MTQETLAEKAGICNSQQMSNIERGSAGLSVPRLKAVCRALNIDADYILFGLTTTNAETALHKYIKQMSSEQIDNLMEIIKIYAKTFGIKEI